MANNEQMDLLKQGSRAWNAWRTAQTEADLDLSDGALRGLDLSEFDFSGADLKDADLRGANLSGANLKGAHLEGSNLFKVLIDSADMKEADLRGVQFLQCPQLVTARNWQSAYRDQDLACGAGIPNR